MTLPIIQWDGEPISKPGIYAGVPNKVYHAQLTVGPSISRSALWRLFDKSPRHYYNSSYLNPNRVEGEETDALRLGRAAHHVLLGEKNFNGHFLVRPDEYPEKVEYGDPIPHGTKMKPWHGASGWCKAWLDDHKEDERDLITTTMVEQIRGMAGGLAEDPMVQGGMLAGLIEHTIVWQDPETGIWIKIRPDAIPTAADDVSDLKTTADITDDGLEDAIGRDGLFLQAAMTDIGWNEVFGRQLNSFNFVFIEKTTPYCARTRELNPSEIVLGHDTYRVALNLFARCLETGEWPGAGGTTTDAEPILMKPWRRTRIERRIAAINQELAA